MKKATHNGHCQICEGLHKLPGEKLAKHGYRVQWGVFNGICPGTGNEPYELSCQLIKEIVPILDREINDLKAYIAGLLNKEGVVGWVLLYGRLSPCDKHSYYYSEVEIEKDPDFRRWGHKVDGVLKFNQSLPCGNSCEEIAKALNRTYADQVLVKHLSEIECFNRRCQKRINDWVIDSCLEITNLPNIVEVGITSKGLETTIPP